ncbi:lantibiotic dehydratase [Sphaerisporangium corydalis]|uniref:Lantibiotic dehydratase n=1 Tax=Sphaerisporangium corydalis TaxID=1441875 RepID=A0ABV9EA49_9ACTN|nr:lantibiotic dehydratase [Sphaerisporangium corydalis]
MARPIFTARSSALARIPLRPADDFGHDTDRTDPLLDEAVTVASGSARNAAYHSGPGALTWRAYDIRSRIRTTPHGVFAGVAPAVFSDEPHLRLGAHHRTVTNPDPQWLSLLARSIISEAGGLSKARLTTSNLAFMRGDRWEIERPMSGGPSQPMTVSVRNTEVTAFVLRACREGLPAVWASAELERRWPQAAPGSGPKFLRELIDGGFLLHDLLPDDPRADPLGHLLDRLPADLPQYHLLEQLRDRLIEADEHRAGSLKRLELLTGSSAVAQSILPADRLLRVDTVVDATVVLPVQVAEKAAEAAGLLWRIGWGTDPLTDYHQRFLTRYGTSQAVPLLDVLDPVTGLGPVDAVAPIGAGNGDVGREAVLARLLSDAVSEGRTEIVLDEATVDRLTNRSKAAVPRSAEVYVRILAGDITPAADRPFQLAVSGGSQDALSTSGRFVPLLGLPSEFPETKDGALVAELVVRPRIDAAASVTAGTGLVPHRIPVGIPPRPGDLNLPDLAVFSDGRRLLVWSQVHDQRVIPVLYSRVALSLLPPVARFLALVGHAGERPWHCWSWGTSTAPFTPAVRYRDSWLTPARWVLPKHLVWAAATSDRWEAALTSWRSTAWPQPPDVVATDDVDRQLLLDLRRVDDRELLGRYVRRGITAVTAPHGGDQFTAAVLPGSGGGHILELVVSLDGVVSPPVSAVAAPPIRQRGAGLYLPGGPWLSLAIQAPSSCHEEVLRSLARRVREIPRRWDRWFWLRYYDLRHGEHLRVRFHADPVDVNGIVLPFLSRWAADLIRQRLIFSFCVEPYDQEIERYGGTAAITAAEQFFDADSRLALDVLSATREEDARLTIAAITAAMIARRVGNGAIPAVRLDRESHRRANTLRRRIQAARNPFPPGWELALYAYASVLPPARGASIASDLIHLHCNRLAPAREQLIRALAIDLIARHTHLTEGSR